MNSEELMAMMNGINPSNVEELVSAMTQMASDKEMWRKKRGEISERSVLKYNKDTMISSYINIFKSCLK